MVVGAMRFFLRMHRARAAWPGWFVFADDDYYVRMHYLSRCAFAHL